MSKWNFISHHTLALLLINRDTRVTARRLAAELGITERSVRRIIKDLQAGGYLQIEKEGRSKLYVINNSALLRRQALGSLTMGEQLAALSQDKKVPGTVKVYQR